MEYWHPYPGAKLEAFMPSQNGATHSRSCDTGACCQYEWSGWQNCCVDTAGMKKRYRFQGNQCTGKWETKEEACDAEILSTVDYVFQPCNDVMQTKRNYVTTSDYLTYIINGQSVINPDGDRVTIGYDINYGRLLQPGTFTLSHCSCQYTLKVVNGEQIWFLIRDGIEIRETVETYSYSKGGGQIIYYYRFGDQWYLYQNNQFNPSRIPPFYGVTTTRTIVQQPTVIAAPVSQPAMTYAKVTTSTTGVTTSGPASYKPVYQLPTVTETVVSAPVVEAKPVAAPVVKSWGSANVLTASSSSSSMAFKPVINDGSSALEVAQKAIDTVTAIGEAATAAGSSMNPIKLPTAPVMSQTEPMSKVVSEDSSKTATGHSNFWGSMWG